MPDKRLELDDLTRLVAQVIGIGSAEADDNFFDLGGDSLHAAQLALTLDEDWAEPIDVMVIITADSLRETYTEIAEGRAAGFTPSLS
jgi:acyl carrier protein